MPMTAASASAAPAVDVVDTGDDRTAPVPAGSQLKKTVDDDADDLLDEFNSTDLGENQCVCGYEFDNFEQLCQHRGIEHKNDSFVCVGKCFIDGKEVPCLEEFDSSDSMWRHYRSVHLGCFYFYCPAQGCTGSKDKSK